ncbi:hypothetical protein GCM10009613_24900 [Pseudonocardia kongjuensis]|uniref:Uncharacterized protein n=1 Tax=Pseudonocardia kongjuensis TaxID=102227 RepID=A0ABP4IID2_9PSEU
MASEVSASSDIHSPVEVSAVTDHSLRNAGMASTDDTRCAVEAGCGDADVTIAAHLLTDRDRADGGSRGPSGSPA